MKARRWVRTQLLPGLGMRVSYNWGTTSEHATIELTVEGGKVTLSPPKMVSPRATKGFIELSAIPQELYEASEPEEVNKAIWKQLAGAYKAWREFVAKKGGR